MKDEATPEQLALARKIVSRFVWTPEDGDLSRRTGPQQATARAMETAALAAIIETTELVAKMLDNSSRVAGERSIAADREDKPDSARNWAAAMVTAENAATAIRAGKHYGKDQQ